MQYLALFFIMVALILFWLSAKRQQEAGLPAGRVIYADTRSWGAVEKPLYDPISGLTGKPDYLVEKGPQIIPVEVKTTRATEIPYDGHIYQLAAYCLLVKNTLGKKPPYGILNYPGRTYAIDFTPALENALIDLLEEMRIMAEKKELNRSHVLIARCSHCGYRSMCDQALVH